MTYSPGQAIWDLATGGADNSTRNSFERRVLEVWDAAVAAGRDDVADMAQREREWLYSSAYTPDAARERVETLEWAAAAMLSSSDVATTTSKPPKPPKPTTSKPPAPAVVSPPASSPPVVKQAGSSPWMWVALAGAVLVGGYFITRGRR